MSASVSSSPLASIESRIGGVRRSIARWFILDGLVRIAAAILVICAIDFAIDYFFQMDRAQRTIMLILMLGAIAWATWKWLLRPLRASITDEAICFEVQRRDPEAGEKVLTSLEFSRTNWSDQDNISQMLVESAIADGGRALKEVPFSAILRKGRFSLNIVLMLLLAILLALGTVGIFSNQLLGIWANRNLMLGHMTWPADFQFSVDGVEDGKMVIPRGDTWPITVNIPDGYKSLPEEVQIEFRTRGGGQRESMNGSNNKRSFSYRITNVVEPFSFRLSSGRVSTEWIEAELIDRPVIDSLRLEVVPPAYTERPPEILPAGSDTYFLLRGTSMKLTGSVDKPLGAATLTIGEAQLPLSITSSGFTAQLDAEQVQPGAWQIAIVDKEMVHQPGVGKSGLGTRDPVVFNVRQLPDKAPSVKADLIGIGSLVLPSARLPFEAVLEDDFKLSKIELEYAWRQEQSEDQTENVDVVIPESAASALGKATAKFEDALDIQPMNLPTSSRLRLRLRAQDNDTVSGPNTGESTDILLRVVDEPELRNQFLIRERQQRQIFEDIAKRQDTLMTDTEAFLAEVRATESVDGDRRSQLFKLQRRQKLIGANIKPVIDSLTAILAEAINNRLPDEEDVLKTRLKQRIITPMQELREELIPGATVPLDSARSQLDSRVARNASLENTLAGQRAIIAAMNEILIHMVKNERFQLAIIRLYEIQRLQNELKNETDAEKEAALKKLLEEQDSDGSQN